jgi:hypothetical protein
MRGLLFLHLKAELQRARGLLDEAAETYEELLTQERMLGQHAARISATLNYAELEHERGATRDAVALVEGVLASSRGNLAGGLAVNLLANLCGYKVALGDVHGARHAASLALERVRLEEVSVLGFQMTDLLDHISVVLALSGELEPAARIAGHCDGHRALTGFKRAYTERRSYEQLRDLFRKHADPDWLREALEAGASTGRDAIVGVVRDHPGFNVKFLESWGA